MGCLGGEKDAPLMSIVHSQWHSRDQVGSRLIPTVRLRPVIEVQEQDCSSEFNGNAFLLVQATGMSLQMWDFVEPHAYESDTDLDSDDDDHTGFSPTRYSEAQIRQALMRPYDYIRAVEELRCCILHFYGRSQMSKDMRHVIEEDATQAFLVQNRCCHFPRHPNKLLSPACLQNQITHVKWDN